MIKIFEQNFENIFVASFCLPAEINKNVRSVETLTKIKNNKHYFIRQIVIPHKSINSY